MHTHTCAHQVLCACIAQALMNTLHARTCMHTHTHISTRTSPLLKDFIFSLFSLMEPNNAVIQSIMSSSDLPKQ